MKLYEKLISDNQGCFDNMKVVLCEHIRGSADATAYVNGICLYCDRHCLHETIDADGKCMACGYTMPIAVIQGGTTGYFRTFEEAVNAVNAAEAKDGFTIKLLKDVKVSGPANLYLTKSSTLDLNGKNISDDSWQSVLYLQDADLTLKDSAPESTAKADYRILENDPVTKPSLIQIESGSWNAVGSSRIKMTGGHVGSLFTWKVGDHWALISGGSIDMLWVGGSRLCFGS